MDGTPTARARRRSPLVAALVTLVLVASVATWLALRPAAAPTAAPAASPRTQPLAPASGPLSPAPASPTPRPPRDCPATSTPFEPTSVRVDGVGSSGVVLPARDVNGVPGVPSVTSAGKAVFAFDREQDVRPGDPAGNVLLNAHTWPDGSALGNRLLEALDVGDRIVLAGAGERLCYRVTERREVPADAQVPDYYDRAGPPQVAIVVCSGRRLGPGQWTERTLWFASPST